MTNSCTFEDLSRTPLLKQLQSYLIYYYFMDRDIRQLARFLQYGTSSFSVIFISIPRLRNKYLLTFPAIYYVWTDLWRAIYYIHFSTCLLEYMFHLRSTGHVDTTPMSGLNRA